jgi:hypothetical protein
MVTITIHWKDGNTLPTVKADFAIDVITYETQT